MKLFINIFILFNLFFLLSCKDQVDWISYRGKQGSGYTPNAVYPPLGFRWKLTLQKERQETRAFNPPVVIGEVIYFGSPDGNFYALNSDSGYMKWIFSTKGAVNSVPYADDKHVYFGSNDGKIYTVNRETGKEVWSYYTGNTVQSLVMRYEDNLIFTSDTGATFFMNPDNGKLNHRIPNPVWSHHTFQVFDGIVYWAPQGRSFGAFEIKTKKFLWFVDVNIPYPVWYSFPALDEDKVYYAASFYTGGPVELHYYALDRKSGKMAWQYEDEMDLGSKTPINRQTLFLRHVDLLDYMAPGLWKDSVIYSSGDTKIRAFHKNTGKLIWRVNYDYPTSSAITIAGDRIYVGLHGDETGMRNDPPLLLCLSAKDGSELWRLELEGAILSAPVISGKRIFFGTDKNVFYVLEEIF